MWHKLGYISEASRITILLSVPRGVEQICSFNLVKGAKTKFLTEFFWENLAIKNGFSLWILIFIGSLTELMLKRWKMKIDGKIMQQTTPQRVLWCLAGLINCGYSGLTNKLVGLNKHLVNLTNVLDKKRYLEENFVEYLILIAVKWTFSRLKRIRINSFYWLDFSR